jgi:hypothetical protein
MSYITMDVEIDCGRVVPREPEKLPEFAKRILTILPDAVARTPLQNRQTAEFPIVRGDGKRLIDPLPGDLNESYGLG